MEPQEDAGSRVYSTLLNIETSSRRFLWNARSASQGCLNEYKFDFSKSEVVQILMEFKTDKRGQEVLKVQMPCTKRGRHGEKSVKQLQ